MKIVNALVLAIVIVAIASYFAPAASLYVMGAAIAGMSAFGMTR